jgi:membrane protease subunit HflK
VVSQAEGDGQRFKLVLAEYQKAPGVTRDRLYLDTMQQVYSNVTKVMVDSRQGSNLLYLPLDKLMSMGAGGGAAAAGSGVTSAPAVVQGPADPPATASINAAAPSAADPRSRDGLRSRDREIR